MDYRNYSRDSDPPPNPHPIWRGIGCIMMIVIPIFSFALSIEVMPILKANGLNLPAQLREGMAIGTYFIEDFFGIIGLTVLFSLMLFALLAIVNAMIFDIARGRGQTLRSLDAPPESYKPKRKRKRTR